MDWEQKYENLLDDFNNVLKSLGDTWVIAPHGYIALNYWTPQEDLSEGEEPIYTSQYIYTHDGHIEASSENGTAELYNVPDDVAVCVKASSYMAIRNGKYDYKEED
jgi:hypothetical protein